MTLGVKIDCSPFYKKGFVCFKKSYLFYKEYKKTESMFHLSYLGRAWSFVWLYINVYRLSYILLAPFHK